MDLVLTLAIIVPLFDLKDSSIRDENVNPDIASVSMDYNILLDFEY